MWEKREIFNELPFVSNFEKDKTDFLLKIGELIEVPERYVLTKQFEPSHSFYFLVEGLVNFSISVEDRTDEFSVGKSSEKFTPRRLVRLSLSQTLLHDDCMREALRPAEVESPES